MQNNIKIYRTYEVNANGTINLNGTYTTVMQAMDLGMTLVEDPSTSLRCGRSYLLLAQPAAPVQGVLNAS